MDNPEKLTTLVHKTQDVDIKKTPKNHNTENYNYGQH
jgi:hypothetical protein